MKKLQKNKFIQNIYIGKTSTIYMKEIDELLAIYENLNQFEMRENLVYLANNKVSSNSGNHVLV